MELYYKDLISEDSSLERLVDDLMLVVQGANEFTEAAASELPPEKRAEMRTHLERIKESCARIKGQAVAGAKATDQFLRKYPYSSAGVAFALGLLAGLIALTRRD
ncbi:MAG TPA: hypothetical protein VLT36_08695 [Candidatus Dormibacteraeota bacterium]|nr:hypothetical protein [Candidatus Dormibacteraeota bacterium]